MRQDKGLIFFKLDVGNKLSEIHQRDIDVTHTWKGGLTWKQPNLRVYKKRDSSKNGIPPETGFPPKWDSSRDGIPPETGFLSKRDSSRKKNFPPVSGGIPFREESRFGRNLILGGIPFRLL